MAKDIRKLVTERGQELAEKAGKLRKKRVRMARAATARSAERIKALKDPIRTVSRSGVKLTTISSATVERLIELQEQAVTAALTDAAVRLERAARAETVQDLMRDQATVLRATRERILADINQAVTILRDAGGDARKVAAHTYAAVTGKAAATPAAAKKKAARRVKRAVRKAPARKR